MIPLERAVLQTIREPSARQLRAGREVLRDFDPTEESPHQIAERVYQAMIDVLIKDVPR